MALNFVGDFETGDHSQWSGIEVFSEPDQFAIVTTPCRQGRYAAQFTVRAGDVVSSGERCEVKNTASDESDGQDYWYSWSTHFPTTWVGSTSAESAPGTTGGGFHVFTQWHDDTSISTPTMAFRAQDDTAKVRLNTGVLDVNGQGTFTRDYDVLSTLSKGSWNDFLVFVAWRTASTGTLRVWSKLQNGPLWKLRIEATGIPTLQSPGAGAASSVNYLKHGLYRDAESYADTLYHDGMARDTVSTQLAGGVPMEPLSDTPKSAPVFFADADGRIARSRVPV